MIIYPISMTNIIRVISIHCTSDCVSYEESSIHTKFQFYSKDSNHFWLSLSAIPEYLLKYVSLSICRYIEWVLSKCDDLLTQELWTAARKQFADSHWFKIVIQEQFEMPFDYHIIIVKTYRIIRPSWYETSDLFKP